MREVTDFSQGDHDGVVTQLHDSALGDRSWSSTMEHIAALFRSQSVILSLYGPDNGVFSVESFSPRSRESALEFYASDVFAQDPRGAYFFAAPGGSIYYDHMLYDLEEMGRNRWVRETCDILGVTYQLGAQLRLPGGLRGAFGILSSELEGHASAAAIRAFHRLAPHIEQACALGLVIEREAATRLALLEALAAKADGVILLDRAGGTTFINDVAQAILGSGDGLALNAGVFGARRLPETRQLQRIVATALACASQSGAAPGGRVLVSRPSGKHPYVVTAMAAPANERFLSGHAVACIVHIQDLAANRLPSRDSLQAVFGLTGRETDLAVELVRCADLGRAAANSGMSLNTARNHLHGILVKTGARGQTDVIQLLGRLP
ncbi:MAG: hypothetical protein Q7T19_12935 [Caulobacter sp.]|nr:hypothetical protein [Caulobacter sp.]